MPIASLPTTAKVKLRPAQTTEHTAHVLVDPVNSRMIETSVVEE
jgi:hypothetical protein